MTRNVSLEDAEGNQLELLELLELLDQGEEIIITKGDQPFAKLVAIPPVLNKPRLFGQHKGKVWMSDDFNAPLPDTFWTGHTGA